MKYRCGNLVKFSILIAIFCLGFLIASGCDRDDTGNKLRDIEQISPEVIDANTQFGFNLFNEIRKTENNKNIFISPFSVSVALAMTLNGASGETEQSMTDALQLQGIDPETINTGYAELQQVLQTSDPKVTLTIANSLWAHNANDDFTFYPDFLQVNKEFFNAEITELNLHDPNTPAQINQWVDSNTDGKIRKIIDKIDKKTGLLLLNAIYFKGEWETEFEPSMTQNDIFYLETGKEKSVPMMRQTDDYAYYEGENFQVVSLPYGSGYMSMYILLPSRESDLNTLLDDLNVERWENAVSQVSEQEVYVQIPKFELEYSIDLSDALKELGMEIAFDERNADFSRMAYSPTGKLLQRWIQKVTQKTFVKVNEEGTEAAAVTAVEVDMGVVSVSIPPEFIADRPFFYAIYDNDLKTVLFMGTVVDPQR